MKLKLFSINFLTESIELKVPSEVMENATWHGGYVDVDLSKISDIENEQPSNQEFNKD